MKHHLSSKRLAVAALLLSGALSSPHASAVILWNYFTTDGLTTISGQLTTNGELTDLAGPAVFNVQQVNSISLDGVAVSFSADLPMTDVSGSLFNWNGTAATAPIFINGFTSNGDQLEIDINEIDSNFNARIVSGNENAQFEPSETRITPVRTPSAVPESSDFGWAFGSGLLMLHWGRRLRAPRKN
jgi:hypothetical protein